MKKRIIILEEPILKTLVEEAKEGDKTALEDLIKGIQDRVYGLAIRMLGHPADAEDATQEILVKIVTHLVDFRQESAFTTWAYRIASNHLLTTRKRRAERRELTFEQCETEINKIASGRWLESSSEAEQGLLFEEIRVRCMQSLLLCLDREQRLAYILGEVFELNSEQGGYILSIAPAAFRQRLSRARKRIQNFMGKNCALIKPKNSCHCAKWGYNALKKGFINRERLLFAGHPSRSPIDRDVLARLQEVDELHRAAFLFRNHPDYAAPGVFVKTIRELIQSSKYALLSEQ
jgi:RNA polymerase sigma factor (sigma-70 family)